MTHYVIKILLTTALVVAISEASKRSSLVGGLLASLPVVSFIAMFWIHAESKDPSKVAALSVSIFWLVLPSLVFFLVLPAFLLKLKLNFYLSFSLATALMLGCYGLMLIGLKRFGVNL
jgi:uncharacterized membrane protein (GlpM family)